jgi:acetylornithine/succinyldiaminopimelate/putrescine aminotransferase
MTAACLMTTYQPSPLSFTRGLGTRLWDQQGREYLDAVAGVAVTNVGHSHPRLVAAISEQAGLLLHTSNLYSIDWQQRLAQRLTRLSGLDQAFFNNSGAEANETALKLARLHVSSSINNQPCRVQCSRKAFRYPGGATCTPLSPWIGSSSTATMRGPNSRVTASSAFKSPKPTLIKSPGSF